GPAGAGPPNEHLERTGLSVMATATPAPVPAPQPPVAQGVEHDLPELRIYSHSNFFYWWPVWAVGYLMAALTALGGVPTTVGHNQVLFHPSQNLGVIYAVVFFLVIFITNVTLRGLHSVIAILLIMLAVVLLAYFGMWETIMGWMPHLSLYMNLGFYVFFSTLIFLVWLASVFVYDRLDYWVIRPGQITHEHVVGGAEKSYDTHGMVFEKTRQDLFRHWIPGMGSGARQ